MKAVNVLDQRVGGHDVAGAVVLNGPRRWEVASGRHNLIAPPFPYRSGIKITHSLLHHREVARAAAMLTTRTGLLPKPFV